MHIPTNAILFQPLTKLYLPANDNNTKNNITVIKLTLGVKIDTE